MRNLEINMRVVSATPSKWVTKPDSYGAIYKSTDDQEVGRTKDSGNELVLGAPSPQLQIHN